MPRTPWGPALEKAIAHGPQRAILDSELRVGPRDYDNAVFFAGDGNQGNAGRNLNLVVLIIAIVRLTMGHGFF